MSAAMEYLVVGERKGGGRRMFFRYIRISTATEPAQVRYSFRRGDAARYSGTDPKAQAAAMAERCRDLSPDCEWRAIPA